MSEDSDSISEEERSLFRPFTRESLAAIEARIAEEHAKQKELEKKRAEGEVWARPCVCSFDARSRITMFLLAPWPRLKRIIYHTRIRRMSLEQRQINHPAMLRHDQTLLTYIFRARRGNDPRERFRRRFPESLRESSKSTPHANVRRARPLATSSHLFDLTRSLKLTNVHSHYSEGVDLQIRHQLTRTDTYLTLLIPLCQARVRLINSPTWSLSFL